MLEFLKAKTNIFGIDAPTFAWVVALGLLLFTIFFAIQLARKTRRQRLEFRKARTEVVTIAAAAKNSTTKNAELRRGVVPETFAKVANYFSSRESLGNAWNDYETQLVTRRTKTGENRIWTARGAGESFTSDKLITENLSLDFYNSVPSIITGVGLLTTFLAILVALLDVRLVDSRVQGLELLIQGLSGKFISSVVALGCATIFLLFEKNRVHALQASRLRLVSALDLLVPQVSSTQILIDLHENIGEFKNETRDLIVAFEQGSAERIDGVLEQFIRLHENVENQTICIQDFSTGLAPVLQQTFDESMTPTLERMVTSIENMNELLRAAEAAKSESITGSISNLLEGLQQSLNTSIETMSRRFNESLSGSAQQQFAAITDTLGNTSALLGGMNNQFSATQDTLRELIEFARHTTKEQIDLGQSQTSDLANMMQSFMHNLSNRVDELGEKITASTLRNAESANAMTNQVIERANLWTAENAKRLEEMRETQQNEAFALADVMKEMIHGMSSKFSELSEQMTVSVQRNSESANTTASQVIERADRWTEHTTGQLERVLVVFQTQFEKVAQTREVLDSTVVKFNESLRGISEISNNTQNSINKILTTVAALEAAASETNQTQQNLQRVSEATKRQIEELGEANRLQATVWERIQNSMTEYEATFGSVEKSASELFRQIDENLTKYQQVCESGFDKLVEISDEHFANAAQKLGASVSELDEHLQDLAESFAKIDGGKSNGNGRW